MLFLLIQRLGAGCLVAILDDFIFDCQISDVKDGPEMAGVDFCACAFPGDGR
jgi:hypothetical protein